MTFIDRLLETSRTKNSLLCVGLDPDVQRLPAVLKNSSDALYRFCKEIIEHTREVAAAFKLNFAFFEAEGFKGWQALQQLLDEMPDSVITIADAKRADIGNTSLKYAEAILQQLNFDAVTVNPYMGEDSVAPFLQWPEKGAFVLGLTSNPGSRDFQQLGVNERRLFETVSARAANWNLRGNVGLVVGATHPDDLAAVRLAAPELPFLIPGVGAQGGSLEASIQYGTNVDAELALINASRSIIFKSANADFAEAARKEAETLNAAINDYRKRKLT